VAGESRVFHRNPQHVYPVAVRGDGCYIVDAAGRRYLDASGGAAVSCLGHSDREVIAAIARQLEQLPYVHTSFFTHEPMERLAEALVRDAPPGIGRVFFCSSGSEAVEGALKLARQYFLEIGQPARDRIIARRQSYHGNTLGALAAGGNAWRRRQFGPLLIDVAHVSPCYAYRDAWPGESPEEYGRRLVGELEGEILRLGPDRVAAFVVEPVVGATLGAVPPVPGYFAGIRAVCDRYGVLLILDEVMCGMGRTGTLYACEQEGVRPDLVTVAKGLGAGYQPIGALLASEEIYRAICDGSGYFQHGHTYSAHAAACAAGLAVQEAIRSRGLLQRVRLMGARLLERLQDRFGEHPHVGDIRGRGLLLGLELVEERDAKRPFPPARRVHARVKQAALDRGLMCYPMGGTVDGESGDHVLLAPPYIIEEHQLDELVGKLAAAVESACST
jgi:adenosylmethionine-8-amino-7-oxononanoate aminotransferase